VWVYLTSPLGPGLAQLTEQAILRDTPVRNFLPISYYITGLPQSPRFYLICCRGGRPP
jgi:hypothetical protein